LLDKDVVYSKRYRTEEDHLLSAELIDSTFNFSIKLGAILAVAIENRDKPEI
jgi:hypothetical protein